MSEKFNIRSFPYFRSRICTNWAKNEIPIARGLKTKSKKLAERKVNKNCFFQKCIYFPSFILLQQEGFLIAPTLKGMLLKRGAGNEHGERENKKMGTKQRIGNEVVEKARDQVRFCSHFAFSWSRSPF